MPSKKSRHCHVLLDEATIHRLNEIVKWSSQICGVSQTIRITIRKVHDLLNKQLAAEKSGGKIVLTYLDANGKETCRESLDARI